MKILNPKEKTTSENKSTISSRLQDNVYKNYQS